MSYRCIGGDSVCVFRKTLHIGWGEETELKVRYLLRRWIDFGQGSLVGDMR